MLIVTSYVKYCAFYSISLQDKHIFMEYNYVFSRILSFEITVKTHRFNTSRLTIYYVRMSILLLIFYFFFKNNNMCSQYLWIKFVYKKISQNSNQLNWILFLCGLPQLQLISLEARNGFSFRYIQCKHKNLYCDRLNSHRRFAMWNGCGMYEYS